MTMMDEKIFSLSLTGYYEQVVKGQVVKGNTEEADSIKEEVFRVD
jgi:hypothetical protein